MRPAPLFLFVIAGWVVLGIVASIWPQWMVVFWGAFALIALVAGVQYWQLGSLTPPQVERNQSHSLSLGEWGRVSLHIHSQCPRALQVEAYDHYPAEMQVEGQPFAFDLGPEESVDLRYSVRPTERGPRDFEPTQILLTYPGCLWVRSVRSGETATVKVYPNFKAVARHALLAVDDQVRQMGVRRRRQRGTGLDFHQLREYREGDVLRQVDWKATSRQHKLISREYQEERDQRVVFLVDCGRRMHARDGDLSHFDHSLNAILLLSFVALRQGDSVGVLTFSGMDKWLPPVKGPGGMTTVLNHVYDLKTTLQPSDYVEAAEKIMRYMPRRCLVVLVTNVREEDAGELRPAMLTLAGRHLVLLASLQETVVSERMATPVEKFDDAVQVAMATQYLADRRVLHEALGGYGMQVLDVTPSELPPALVDRYLDIKSRGAL